MNAQYQKDEKAIRDIVHQHVSPRIANQKVQLIIYYKNRKVREFLMKNNLNSSFNVLQTSWSVYKIICLVEGCDLQKPFYIGHTRNTIETR